jgi:hypothetical protein
MKAKMNQPVSSDPVLINILAEILLHVCNKNKRLSFYGGARTSAFSKGGEKYRNLQHEAVTFETLNKTILLYQYHFSGI